MNIRLFQFHKGTIRTSMGQQKYIQKNYFNSIKVRLELFAWRSDCSSLSNFNSIKVRLEPVEF